MQQIHHIEQQNYSGQDVLETGDELEAISIKLNQLADTIRDRENALETSKARLEYLSNHDVLTQLPNRRFFSFRLSYALEQARTDKHQLALMYLDLDQFKQVNDTLGHHVGDLLLAQVAERLRDNVGLTDTLARIGGDEFNILIERQEILQDLSGTARKLLDVFRSPFNINGQMLSISSSIGIAVYPQDGDTATDLIKHADIAMYQAKEAGRNNFCFFSEDMSRHIQEKARLHRALRQAVQDGNQFVLHYQPKISPVSGQITGVEALVRWVSPEHGFIPPDRFIPLAEESGLINALGRWVLKQGCQDFIHLKSMGIHLQHISINVSNIQLNHRDFLQELKGMIADTGITPEQLELEMTESFIASDQQEAIQILQTIRNMGLQLAIDDFGTGYSAMSFLQKLPITRLKIDKSFVDGLPHDNDSIALVKAMLSLAENFSLAVTAEGVEYQEQMEFLKKAGCHEIQGYFYSRPLPFDDLVTYCKARKNR
nr:EAL domain-containing protein [Oceanospirillum sediminis]